MISVSPKDVERYHLRMLLCFVKGPKSFEDLRTVDGVIYDIFQMAAAARGLLEDQHRWMGEAIAFRMPRQLRHLFAIILACCSPSDLKKIWEEDFQHQLNCDTAATEGYIQDADGDQPPLAEQREGFEFVPSITATSQYLDVAEEAVAGNTLIATEQSYDRTLQQLAGEVARLNDDQESVFHTIMAAIRNESSDQKLFFCDGPGGTGKSFLLEKVLATVRRDGEIAIAVATSGIAALQLMGGRTAHSTFKLGLKLTSTSTCDISPQSQRAELIRRVSLIVWDEASMMHRHGFEAVDRTLRDILQVD